MQCHADLNQRLVLLEIGNLGSGELVKIFAELRDSNVGIELNFDWLKLWIYQDMLLEKLFLQIICSGN